MGKKLTAITPEYSSFENDQVLTAAQLNEFLNYFDDQDRLSRICLSGVGIVCGFKLNFTPEQQLIISQGCGVTTDGDLLKLQVTIPDSDGLKRIDIPEILYTHFAPFVDDKALYKPFFYKESGGVEEQIPLWELFPIDLVTNQAPISDLPNLEDKVVLLYLEAYNEDADLCVGVSCDNQGILQVQNLRVLLVDQENADYIMSFDTIFDTHDILSTYFNLDDVVAPRVLVNESNTASFEDLNDSYNSAIRKDGIVDNVKSGIEEMLLKLDMEPKAVEIIELMDSLFSVSNLPQNTLYFQYRYDLYKDVIDTYLEMKELFLEGDCLCSPDIHSFPKHLMLGKLIPTAEDTLYKRYRHSFYKSPILCCNDSAFERFKMIVERLIAQMRTYIKGAIPRDEIKITPSKYNALLGQKAIPFYYDLQTTLLNKWSYEKTTRNQQRRNLSYHTNLLSPSAAIQTPLKYNLEPFNFLRIEGHQGYLYQEAMDKIDQIKYNNGLSFDLKALGITISPDETIDIDDYMCEFEDLKVLLDSWRKEHECIMANASYYLSSYSLVKPDSNGRFTEYVNPMKIKMPLSKLTPEENIEERLVKEKYRNPVQENLDTKENTMGNVVAGVLKEFEGCSANDIIFQVHQALSKWDFSQWEPVLYDTTINKPMEILSHSYVLLNELPQLLPEFTPQVINDYSINASNICSLAKKVQAINTGELPPSLPATQVPVESEEPVVEVAGDFNKDYNTDFSTTKIAVKEPSMVNLLMHQLAEICCSTKKLQAIYDEIEARKQRILLRLKLAEFVKHHPGLEHYAGTPQGGTFILVYITSPVYGIAGNTVIADFTLPYSCCSDCTPVNYIMPRPEVSLSLSQERFCIGQDKSPLVFTVSPNDGVIEADQDVPGMEINGTDLIIDPDLIPESIYGTPIYFTVNGQATSCNLTFYKSPEVDFNVPESPTTETLITFEPIGSFEEGTTFFWNFGDGQTSEEPTVTHQYELPVNEENRVTVTLTATAPSGACRTRVQKDIQFEG
ncbi:MAG TPA: PKD domain-containing protein [Brumimicrobium sp.]|nr:PKD domain-containing protein [Brumimicrobium sp.]